MSGYRKVNYYELCRLCTSSEGSKMNIFRDEGRRRQLQTKIQTYLPIQVMEEDSLPKIVCHECVKKLESFIEFRETVINAEGMLESYFTSLRFSEEFLKEGKVYVKNTEKERSSTPEDEVLKSIDKVPTPVGCQILNNQQSDQIQHQQPVVVSNINTSNIQIISGVQARVQQYKCAMQMQPGGMAAAVVEATAETHYSYQQQTSQVSSQQSNEAQNQINDQQNQSSAIHQQQAQNQISNQINQQLQSQRTIPQQLNQSTQLSQQNQSQISQQIQGQSQISHQLQQLQRQREFEKQHRQLQLEKQQVQIITQQEFSVKQETPVVHQNNNIVLKSENDMEPNQVEQKIQSETQKDKSPNRSIQTYTTVQTAPEVFLNLDFKENPLTVRDDKDFKEFTKTSSDDGISRNSIEQIREFLRLRSGSEPTSLITVNPPVLSQARTTICRDCGKSFSSLNQMSNHNCNVETLVNGSSDVGSKDDSLQTNVNSFNCDICSKPFKRKEHLFQHRKLHTGERPYVCTTCSKAFSRKEHLVRHSVSHTGQKMHECEMCGKSFSRKDNLHKHRKTHGVSGPYICETCGKSFVVKHYYVMHLTTHAVAVMDGINCPDPLPYKCDICHKAFSVKQYLTTHRLRHRSKNNNNSTQNGLSGHQSNATNNTNVVTNNVSNIGNLNNNNGQSRNDSTVEMQSVIERNEQINGFVSNQYHANIQELQ
ncbi:zinc finger protein 267-like [Pogonomyrmex barbatus]|uniref:Zinc finger protein 267-like n=1 Tax=Pogonomyrmex barbatus TaxID=144034 RepID=A0A6I9WU84_9HYME|nr:zinc finger protein 267-like [Pogonomyrmex barbatus]